MTQNQETHITRDGQTMLVSEMSDSRLRNTIAWIKQRAKRGLVITGGMPWPAEEMNAIYVSREEAEELLELDKYEREQQRRKGVGAMIKETHITRDGQEMLVSEMSDSHLANMIAWIKRRAKQGIFIGGGIPCAIEEMNGFYVFHEEAEELLELEKYEREQQRRITQKHGVDWSKVPEVIQPSEIKLFRQNWDKKI